MHCEECEPCGRTVTFGGLHAVGTAEHCRVRFVTRSLSGRDLSAVELLRHPLSAVSAPLGGAAEVSVTADVDEAPTALMAVLIDDAENVIGTAPFTLHDLPPGGEPFELLLTGSEAQLRFVARHSDDEVPRAKTSSSEWAAYVANGVLLAKASISLNGKGPKEVAEPPPAAKQSSWPLFSALVAQFSCASSRSCFAIPKMPAEGPPGSMKTEPRLG